MAPSRLTISICINAPKERRRNNNNAAPHKAAAFPRAAAPRSPQPVARCRRQERALTVRGSGAAPPTAHCAGGGYVAGSTMRYLAADAGWNVRVRSFGLPSATAPCTWSMVTAWMRRTGVMMHRCHAPAFLRRRELSALCVFGADGLNMRLTKQFISHVYHGHARLLALSARPGRPSSTEYGVVGAWGHPVPLLGPDRALGRRFAGQTTRFI